MALGPLSFQDRGPIRAADGGLKTRSLAVIILLALIAGIGSTAVMLGERPPLGAYRLGPWQTFPRIGSSEVDPYGRALLARGPHLPLAVGEGIRLNARTDDAGAPLTGSCSYRVVGNSIPSRGWTLAVVDLADRALTGPDAAALSDADLVTSESADILITVSSRIAAGNWLRVPQAGRFGLVLRFYDTPLAASLGQLSPGFLPRIERIICGH
ncbi:MAG: DUF1214 domain-containing protein [Hyphomicrobiales bacterium]|nr:DUF1214 domain-containing protein [Hyphomicrobiales bacterium]